MQLAQFVSVGRVSKKVCGTSHLPMTSSSFSHKVVYKFTNGGRVCEAEAKPHRRNSGTDDERKAILQQFSGYTTPFEEPKWKCSTWGEGHVLLWLSNQQPDVLEPRKKFAVCRFARRTCFWAQISSATMFIIRCEAVHNVVFKASGCIGDNGFPRKIRVCAQLESCVLTNVDHLTG